MISKIIKKDSKQNARERYQSLSQKEKKKAIIWSSMIEKSIERWKAKACWA